MEKTKVIEALCALAAAAEGQHGVTREQVLDAVRYGYYQDDRGSTVIDNITRAVMALLDRTVQRLIA